MLTKELFSFFETLYHYFDHFFIFKSFFEFIIFYYCLLLNSDLFAFESMARQLDVLTEAVLLERMKISNPLE
jgi:hypothetical protein